VKDISVARIDFIVIPKDTIGPGMPMNDLAVVGAIIFSTATSSMLQNLFSAFLARGESGVMLRKC
jgi:hypothetical protein